MYYRLSLAQEKYLLAQPETGMGYQLIEAKRDGTEMTAKFIVLNAELAVELDQAAPYNVKEVATHGIAEALRKAMDFRWTILHVVQQDDEYKPYAVAQEVKEEFPDGDEIFVRRSIYENDKRIDSTNNSLRTGSFTTTLSDSMKHRNTSEDPLIQLAMDHGVRGKWGYHFRPKRTDSLQRGKIDPQTGAKEVYFKKGTSSGTYLQRESY